MRVKGECTCDSDERTVVKTVAWQRDHCNTCGCPIPETKTDAPVGDG